MKEMTIEEVQLAYKGERELTEDEKEWLRRQTLWYGKGLYNLEDLNGMQDAELANAFLIAIADYYDANFMT